MLGTTTQILDHLLARLAGPAAEVELHAPRAFTLRESDHTGPGFEAAVADFRREFRTVAGEIAADWGPPDFVGEPRASEYPGLPAAREVAYWKKGDCVACVYWGHPDREPPVTLVLATFTVPELKRLGGAA